MKQPNTIDITHYPSKITLHDNLPSRKRQNPKGITCIHIFELYSDAYYHDFPFQPVNPSATCIPLACLHDLIGHSSFCNSCKSSLEGQCCTEASKIPLHPKKNTMRRQTLGVPITTRQHIHHHKCWQAVIGIPTACADTPSTKVHKTYRNTSAPRYVSS
jgi:hypothetical protein